jgi:hypothetical protein
MRKANDAADMRCNAMWRWYSAGCGSLAKDGERSDGQRSIMTMMAIPTVGESYYKA